MQVETFARVHASRIIHIQLRSRAGCRGLWEKYRAAYVREKRSFRFKNETSRRYFLSYLTVGEPSEMSNTAPPAIQLPISRKSPSCVAFCPRATTSSFSTAHLRGNSNQGQSKQSTLFLSIPCSIFRHIVPPPRETIAIPSLMAQ